MYFTISLLFLFSPVDFDFLLLFFFFNDPATTEIYTLSLHDALPIFGQLAQFLALDANARMACLQRIEGVGEIRVFGRAHEKRSEEHTSELQSQSNLVCRLLLEKKKKKKNKKK